MDEKRSDKADEKRTDNSDSSEGPFLSDDELQVLAQRHLDGVASPDDFESLSAALTVSAAHRRSFVAECMAAALLTEGHRECACEVSPCEEDKSPESLLACLPQHPAAVQTAKLGSLWRTNRMLARWSLALALQWILLAMLGGTFIALVVIGPSIFRGIVRGVRPAKGGGDVVNVNGGASSTPIANPPAPVTVALPVARLSRAKDCRWIGQEPGPELGNPLLPGRKLCLIAGVAEIDFDIGARVIVQSPATLKLLSANSAQLEIGKATVEIKNERARGFQILTPRATFVDQGTEFGVEVSPGGSSKVHVFQGLVDVDRKGQDGGKPQPSQRLAANSGAFMESGEEGMTLVHDTGECFIRSMNEADRDRHTVAYWRFEDRPTIPNRGEPVPHTSSNTQVVRGTVDSSFNGNDLFTFSTSTRPNFSNEVATDSVLRNGAANHGCLDNTIVPVEGSPSRNLYTRSRFSHASPIDIQTVVLKQWTIEASIKAKVLHAGVQTFVGRDGGSGGARLAFRINVDDHLEIFFYDIKHRQHKVVAPWAMHDNKWYHVVAESDGKSLRLYADSRDGRGYQLAATTDITAKYGSTALGSTNPNAEWSVGRGRVDHSPTEWFQGWIDEVRISNVALEPSDFLFAAKSPEKTVD